jgi:NTP pyrophosphatase (non-canonical NTP hydrolase)
MTNKLEICRKALDKFGIVNQMGMMHEEMGELGVALEHYKRGRCKEEAVVTEIADVMIVAAQMALYFGKEEVDAEINRKLEKLNQKL